MVGAISSFEPMTATPVSATGGVMVVAKTRKGEKPVTRANIKSELNDLVLNLCILAPPRSKLSFAGGASKARPATRRVIIPSGKTGDSVWDCK